MNDITTYFYGIDFKKIKLYCKIKIKAAIQTKERYLKLNKYLNLSFDQYYEVIFIHFHDEYVAINVTYKEKIYNSNKSSYQFKDEDCMKIYFNFNMVEFSYFFEDTKNEQLNELEL